MRHSVDKKYVGVSPIMESKGGWHPFHTNIVVKIMDALNDTLPPNYVAFAERRLEILPEEGFPIVDAAILERTGYPLKSSSGGTAVLERGVPHGRVAAFSEDVYEKYLEIRHGFGAGSKVVTVIEVLSPGNKAGGCLGRKEYKEKQRQLTYSDTNLLEIDLLQSGAHTVLATLGRLPPRSEWDFIVSLHRVEDRLKCDYWLNKIGQPLPEVQVPLLPGDPDVILDLEAAYRRAFDSGRYSHLLDKA